VSTYGPRVRRQAARARAAREAFVPPADPPERERALAYLREGLGPTVSIYLEGRTGGRLAPFDAEEYARLERAVNDWLALYVRCHGEHPTGDVTLRAAAKLLVETHDLPATARVLTRVPSR
jgi:hypothetical protein